MARILVRLVVAVVVIGAAAAYAVYHHFDQEILPMDDAARHSADASRFGGSYVQLTDGVTHYELAGPDSGRTVVLVHGFSVPYYIWDPTFAALTQAGFQVLRYDLYGRGLSDRPAIRYDADLYVRQLRDLLGALKIDGPVDLIGVSMGGPIVVDFAARNLERVRTISLFDPAYGQGYKPPLRLAAPLVGDFLFCVAAVPGMPGGQRGDFFHPERYPDYFEKYTVQMRYRGFRHALLSTLRDFLSQDVTPAYRAVGKSGKPVLLVWGRADQDVPFEVSNAVRKDVPQAEFHAIEDAAHVPFYEHPEIVNPILIEFLRR